MAHMGRGCVGFKAPGVRFGRVLRRRAKIIFRCDEFEITTAGEIDFAGAYSHHHRL